MTQISLKQNFKMVGRQLVYEVVLMDNGMVYLMEQISGKTTPIPEFRLQEWLRLGLWEEVMNFE